MEIKLHAVYRHFKGNYYFVESLAHHTETDETLVIYRALYDTDISLYARPLSMFLEEIDKNKPGNLTHQPHHFELVEELAKNLTKPHHK